MPTPPDNHDAHHYGERIRERLPRRHQELRDSAGFTKYGLARERGVSRGPSHGQTFIIIGGTAGTML